MTFRRPSGFTLLETVLYAFLLALFIGNAALLARSLFMTRTKLQSNFILEENMRFAMTRITSRIRAADDIFIPSVATTSSSLVLTMSGAAENPTTITSTSGTITISQGVGAAVSLTSREIQITSLIFTRLTATPPQVRIEAVGRIRQNTALQPPLTMTQTITIPR
ncbi:MAG: hypothetical protein Q7N87_02240 [Candidatus Uhrbacteria bacterium]|nr:hypothetical protein [Candidatus Uhrbacteria bacterium]